MFNIIYIVRNARYDSLKIFYKFLPLYFTKFYGSPEGEKIGRDRDSDRFARFYTAVVTHV